MKKFLFLGLYTVSFSIITSCQKSAFDEYYRDPSTTTETTIDKQFAGITYAFRELVIPSYWNYFVIHRITSNRYLQTTGWVNEPNHLTPGAAAIQDRWSMYYAGLTQFKEFERVYQAAPEVEQQERRIFYLAAKIFFYDQTQQVVDLHGDIPWSEAGALNANAGDYSVSYPAYDTASGIYTAMLDDLKVISSELNELTIPAAVRSSFETQDIINGGNLDAWKRYCNSLRLRMLMRVSDTPDLSARAQQEMAEIVENPGTNPLALTNAENIQIEIFDNTNAWIHSRGLRDALESEGWNANLSSKAMIDHMVDNEDPRLPFMFEPGSGANGKFIGLDQSLAPAAQEQLIRGATNVGSTLAIYNRSTYSRNQNFPGIIFTAAEVQFLLAEYYAENGNDAAARTAFETGIRESIEMIRSIREISNDNTVEAPADPTAAAVDAYISNIGWSGNRIELIAAQKWLHFNIIQPNEGWAENRRLDYPVFSFRVEPSDIQKTVPVKWNLPASEVTYNFDHYQAVQASDNVNTKIFWDVN